MGSPGVRCRAWIPEDNPTCDAADLAAAGDRKGARELLMDVLCEELRCLGAHAHLGNLVFDRAPASALTHYEMGMRIGELSLPSNFNGLLVWGRLYNRAFLRCLHGYGLCLWRLGRREEAQRVFERILALNPADHQGVRFCCMTSARAEAGTHEAGMAHECACVAVSDDRNGRCSRRSDDTSARLALRALDPRFYIDPATGLPHILAHGVTEDEVEQVPQQRLRRHGDGAHGQTTSRLSSAT